MRPGFIDKHQPCRIYLRDPVAEGVSLAVDVGAILLRGVCGLFLRVMVGALTMETRGVATNADEVRRQGGFATAAAVRWTQVPEQIRKLSAVAY